MPRLSQQDRILALSGFLWFTLMGLSVTMTGPISALMGQSLGQPKSSEAQIFVAIASGAAAIVALNAMFSSHFTGRWVARFCACAYAAGATVVLFAQSWPMLLTGYVMIGLGNGGHSFWYNAEFARNFRDRGVGVWLSMLNGFWAVGAVVGPLLVGKSPSDWRWPVWILWIFCLLPTVFAWFVQPPPPTEATEEAKERLPLHTYGLMVLLGLYVGVETTTLTFMSRQLMEVHGVALAAASAIASSLWFAFMISRFATGPISLKLHPSRIVLAAACLGAIGAYLTAQPGLGLVSYVMIGLAMGPVFPAVIQWGTSLSHAPHRATAIMVLGPCICAVAFPAVAAIGIGEHYSRLPWIVLAIHVCIAVGSVMLHDRKPAS